MSGKYVLSLDQGTTSSRAILFDRNGQIVSFAQQEIRQIYPQSGWVEHDPDEIWRSQLATAVDAIRKASAAATDIVAVGITNQRETTIVWDRASGRPIYNAIVWQDRRTAALCDEMRDSYAQMIRGRTGLEVDAYFSATKIRWILDNVKNAREMAEAGALAFGTVDSWLIWNLTGGRLHVTDHSNAARTMLYSLESLEWDTELLDIFGIPRGLLPEIVASSATVGEISCVRDLMGIPIAGIAGDQQAALFGQACFDEGNVKNTYGTGCFMLMNTGHSVIGSANRLISTVGWRIEGKTSFALEGSVFIGGAIVQWLRDEMGLIASSADVENLATSVRDNGGVYFVPGFAGLGAPHWNQDARGMIIGLTRGTGRAHIARAALEAIAFQTADLIESMHADIALSIPELKVDGGAAANDTLMQIQADLLGIPVVRSATTEATALGAAYLAGLATGFWESEEEISSLWSADKTFEPEKPPYEAKRLRDRWNEAVSRSLNWART